MVRRVLLIEDEPHIAEAIGFLLTREGWQVTHLARGEGAVDLARRLGPELVILDQMLPGISGLEVLDALRADPASATVPVLMLTARGHPRDREAALKAGATRFMAKPFANSDILAEVRAMSPAPAATGPGVPR